MASNEAAAVASAMTMVEEAIAQNTRQWETFSSTLLTTLDHARSESESRLKELLLQLSNIATASASSQQKSGSPNDAAQSRISAPRGSPLQALDINLTSASQQSASSKAEADKLSEEVQILRARVATAERERDSVKEKYKIERAKQQRFKAWWDANMTNATSQTHADVLDELARDGNHAGSPFKKRKMNQSSSPAPDNGIISAALLRAQALSRDVDPATAGHGGRDDEMLMPMSPIPHHASRASTSTSPDKSSALRNSFAKLHLSRSDKSLLRTVGLRIPKSPVKTAVDSSPDTLGEDATDGRREDQPLTCNEDNVPFHSASSNPISSSNATPLRPESDQERIHMIEASVFEQPTEEAKAHRTSTEITHPFDGELSSPAASTAIRIKTEVGSETVFTTPSEPERQAEAVAGPSSISPTKTASRRVRYELDPVLNRGRAFEYHEVVRGREARKQLIATDCMECEEWYAQTDAPSLSPAGPVYEPYTELGRGLKTAREERKAREAAAKASAPRRSLPYLSDLRTVSSSSSDNSSHRTARSPGSERRRHHPKCKHGRAGSGQGRREEVRDATEVNAQIELGPEDRVVYNLTVEDCRQAHRQAISRHRNTAPVSLTPPGFWDVTFPSTQRVEELNAQTEAQREAHVERMGRDPRYRIRKSR